MLLALAVVAALQAPAHAYLKLGSSVNGRTISLQWPARTPVRYFISDRGVDGVSAPQFREAVGRGFDTWQAVETASVGFEFGGFVGGRPLDQDGANVIGFASRPDLERTLASTSFLIDTRTGEILESDIFFNSTFQWSVAPGGEAGRFDVQSIATHESGHFLGLGHSLLGETEPRPTGGRRLLASGAVMFPIAFTAGNIVDRDLTADDIAGVSDIYPDGDVPADDRHAAGDGDQERQGRLRRARRRVQPAQRTTWLAGSRWTTPGPSPSRGWHPARTSCASSRSTTAMWRASSRAPSTVDADFKAKYYERLVTVPEGGGSVQIAVEVVAK